MALRLILVVAVFTAANELHALDVGAQGLRYLLTVEPAVVQRGCTDTSDPRHFGPKTLRHHRDGSEMSGQFGTGAEVSVRQFGTSTEVSIRHFGTSAELSAVRRLFNV